MIERETRRKDNFPCRLKNCKAEEWIENHVANDTTYTYLCDDCPFMSIVNKLAEYEDYEETTEEDWK